MDSVTQAVLGAGIQGALLGRAQGRRALIYGAALATLPDLDVMMRYPDPVSLMTHHRGFSHSVFVLTALAALLAWLIRRYWPLAPYSGRRLFLTLWLVLVTHPVLDAFTVYGTQLFWPLPRAPESWSAIFIIDPVYTLPLLAAMAYGVSAGLTSRARRLLAAALVFSTAYLGFGLAGRLAAEQRVREAMRQEGIAVSALRAVPMPFNTLLWRVIAKTPDGGYYEAVSGWLDGGARPEWGAPAAEPGGGAAAFGQSRAGAAALVYGRLAAVRPHRRRAGGHRPAHGHGRLLHLPLQNGRARGRRRLGLRHAQFLAVRARRLAAAQARAGTHPEPPAAAAAAILVRAHAALSAAG